MRNHGRGFGRSRGRGRNREHSLLETRMLEPSLLVLLSKGDLHGYNLLDQLESLGLSSPHPSVVYRILREMEDAGWVSSIWDREQTQGPPRRVYSLTEEGQAALRSWRKQLEQTREFISRLLDYMSNGYE